MKKRAAVVMVSGAVLCGVVLAIAACETTTIIELAPDRDDAGLDDFPDAPTPGSPDTTAAGDATSPPDAAATGTAEDGGDGATDGPNWTDDPCPDAASAYVNCSDTCAYQNEACDQTTCSANDPYVIDAWALLPEVFRTPSHAGLDPACNTSCMPSPPPNYSLTVYETLPALASSPYVVIRVGPPWLIAVDGCPPAGTSSCASLPIDGKSQNFIRVWTDDPNAPSRNIEIVPAQEDECP